MRRTWQCGWRSSTVRSDAMDKEPLVVKRSPVRFTPDPKLTITRLFWAGAERARRLIDRILVLTRPRPRTCRR